MTSRIESKKSSGTDQQLIMGKAQPPVHLTQGESVPTSFFENSPIPNGWKVASVSEFGRVLTGGTPRTVVPEFWGGGIPWITPTDIDPMRSQVYPARTISEAGLSQVGELPGGSVLVTCIASIGKNAILRVRGACNQQINAIIPDLNVTTIDFVYYALEFAVPRLRLMAGTTATPMVSKKTFLTLQILKPIDLLEQAAIAEVLSDTDLLLESFDKLITKKRAIKQGVMQQLLTGQTRLPGFSDEWRETSLGKMGNVYGGLSGKSKQDFDSGTSHFIPFVNVMANLRIDPNTLAAVSVAPGENQNSVTFGDLIFNGSSETPDEVGLASVVDFQADLLYLNSFCFGYHPTDLEQVDSIFLAYLFRGQIGRRIMSSLAQGSTRYNLSKPKLLASKFKMPDIVEQRAIAEVLSDMDTEIEALVKQIEKTALIKIGLMQDLLTGKVRL